MKVILLDCDSHSYAATNTPDVCIDRCDDYCASSGINREILDHESGQGARFGDAPDEEGEQWYFGMKAHSGVDSKTKLIHSVVAMPANVHDKHVIPQLLHGKEHRVYGDSAYSSQQKLIAQAAPKARDFTNQKGFRNKGLTEREREKNSRK